ncbi:hypothetical protein LQG66_32570 [Bradyrhizobium ontarionense]|uniref:Uncharacterized protein n=1 Tax=Bradyrhizobium ontarionense TaxID=2898149 RepID=A0ABY3R939_9BRAD|nr:hypothetical protein [Bradyrhizobium sp. A19]UFZ03880.1 hypothetical protein LQG66_32570 [Bradyrhizobium sp. A19]
MPVRFDILPGLPAYGPPAISFPKSDVPTFREGLVVRFQPEQSEPGGDPWVGNFLRGSTDYDRVLAHPNGREAIVVSGGQGNIVDAETRSVTASLGDLTQLVPLDALGLVLVQGLTDFMAIGAEGVRWQSPRISWDGFRKVSVEDHRLFGEAYSAAGDDWFPFTLDLATGACTDGVYQHDIARAVSISAGTPRSRRSLPRSVPPCPHGNADLIARICRTD